jgi:uncharacterized membrane protein
MLPGTFTDSFFFEELPFFQFSLYEMCLLFVFWSFVGWAVEVVTMTIQTGEYQNRGFLNMPICPIYGAGVILVVTFFRPIADTWILLFFCTSLLCTGFELLVGIVLEKIFQNRWWDYSMFRFNFKGLICLWVSVGWGIGCVIVLKGVEPLIEKLIDEIPIIGGIIFLAVMLILIIIDLMSSVRAAINLNLHLKRIDDISGVMLKSAQGIGKRLAGGTQKAMAAAETAKGKAESVAETAREKVGTVAETAREKVGTVAETAREKVGTVAETAREKVGTVAETAREKVGAVAETARDDAKERLEALMNTRNKAMIRLLKAFPTMRSRRYMRALRILQKQYEIKYIPDKEEEKVNENPIN